MPKDLVDLFEDEERAFKEAPEWDRYVNPENEDKPKIREED